MVRRRGARPRAEGAPAAPGGATGRGIGLALVRRAAGRRGGSAVVGVSPAGGARVEVRMPPRGAEVRTGGADDRAGVPGATVTVP